MHEVSFHIRKAVSGDEEALADLIYRFYRFNEEFDPAWSTTRNALEVARERASRYISCGEGCFALVALMGEKIVGYAYTEIYEAEMLEEKNLAVIKELYVLPQYRRIGIASRLVDEVERIAREELGVEYIAAQFPTANFVAEKFYRNRKFRPFISIYLREV